MGVRADGERERPAAAAAIHGPEAVVHMGLLCGVQAQGSDLMLTRQELVVADHGTGTGRVSDLLTVSAAEGDRLVPPTGRSTVDVGLRKLVLHEVEGDPDMVDVIDRSRPADRQLVRSRRIRLADHLLARFTHERLDPHAPEPCLHGGAVAERSGRAALVLGPSGAGKSTLIAHLVHGGLDLLNDEQITVFSEHGVVGGFTRPIGVKPGGVEHLPLAVRADIEAGEFGALVTAAQLGGRHRLLGRPILIVVPERTSTGGDVSWESLSPGEALEALCANNLDLVRKPISGLESLAWLASVTIAVRLRYGDAAAGAETIVRLLGEADPSERLPRTVDVGAGPVPSRRPSAAREWGEGGARVPAEAVVAVTIGDELVVFHRLSRAVVRLNAAAAAVWRELPVRPGTAVGDRLVADLDRLGFLVEGPLGD